MTDIAIVLVALLAIRAVQSQATTTVYIKPGSQNVKGELQLTQEGAGVSIKGKITGLKPGLHGFHIHETGDLNDKCKAAGAHFNPYQKRHGDISETDANRHVGDLGNVFVDETGTADININDKLISLDPNYKSFIGNRAIVIHEGKDDLGRGGNEESLKTGNAGGRAGCGLIDYSTGHRLSSISSVQLTIGCITWFIMNKRFF